MSQPIVDIVIPVYNEESCIGRTIETLFEHVSHLPYRFELIAVDDGSEDRSAEIVQGYLDRYPITLISLTRNFGKEPALLAGLDHARGDATILMDADLQHPVELIDEFLAQWEAGYECVYGVREHRREEALFKRLFAKVFYLGLSSGSSVHIVPDAGDFRLLDRAAVRALCSIRERVRFTKGLYAWLGFRSIGVPFTPAPRIGGGASRFNRARLFQLGWDGLTSFSDLPLRLAGIIGAFVAVCALFYGFWILLRTLIFGVDVPGWATLTDAIMFFSGLQLLFLGVIGVYIRNVFIETKLRPNYLVRRLSGLAASARDSSKEGSQPNRDGDDARAASKRAGSDNVAAA
jgi:polyisoprenyl-phosphate glycosyltransferase